MISGKIIAIDFDGTITKNSPYPKMGGLRKNCKETIDFIRKNNFVVLWTCREGKFLEEALIFLKKNNIEFDAINDSGSSSRKIVADIYIDDRNIFCEEIDWLKIKKYFQ